MGTYTQLLYHVVFSTKNRDRVLLPAHRDRFLRYTYGVISGKQSHVYQVNCVEDHMHLFVGIHPKIAVSDFVKDIKLSTSDFIRREHLFPNFSYWQEGYGAFTHSFAEKQMIVDYVRNQQEHHARVNYVDEFRKLLQQAGVEFEEKYLL